MSESKTKETASRLSLSTSWWSGVLPCLARPLSLSCHATTIAQLDVSVCLMFKMMALCPVLPAPCCLALACLVPLLPRLPCVLCGLVCCVWCVCLACCVSLLPSCPCALPLACPASLCLCCLSLPWLLCGLACPDWPCSLLPGPLLSSPSALAAAIHLKVSHVYSLADIWPRLPGCLLLYAWL